MAERIKQLRLERQMTQEELGNIVGLQKQAIWKYENGNVTNMKQSTIKSLSDFFGVTPSYLMGYSDNRTERDIDVNKMTVGERIKIARKEAGLTQDEVAKRIGTTRQAIYKYENGIVTNIPLDRLQLIANGLNCSSAWLMGWTEKQNGQSIDDDKLSEADKKILELFHKVPLDKREAVIQMIEVALKMQI